jgi:hypothetical protein
MIAFVAFIGRVGNTNAWGQGLSERGMCRPLAFQFHDLAPRYEPALIVKQKCKRAGAEEPVIIDAHWNGSP